MVDTPAQGRIDVGTALNAGWRFVVGRPLTVLLWSAVGLLPAAPMLLLILAAMSGRIPAFRYWPLVLAAMVIWSGLIGVAQASAAMRSVLRPEDSRFGYLRWRDAEWHVLTLGLGRNPRNWPLAALLLVIALTVLFIAGFFAFPVLAPSIREALNIASGSVLVLTIIYIAMRSSLAPVAAHAGWPDAQGVAWARSGRTVLPIALMQLGSHLIWLAASAVVALAAWGAIKVIEEPNGPFALFSGPGPASWRDLISPDLLVAAYAVALIGALHGVLCVRPAARAWQMLVGDRRTRNVLADVTG